MTPSKPVSDCPAPPEDWIPQCEVAKMLGFSERTASIQAKAGRLKRFQHGVSAAGRRKYSRALVDRELQRNWEGAVRRQDRLLDQPDENK